MRPFSDPFHAGNSGTRNGNGNGQTRKTRPAPNIDDVFLTKINEVQYLQRVADMPFPEFRNVPRRHEVQPGVAFVHKADQPKKLLALDIREMTLE